MSGEYMNVGQRGLNRFVLSVVLLLCYVFIPAAAVSKKNPPATVEPLRCIKCVQCEVGVYVVICKPKQVCYSHSEIST